MVKTVLLVEHVHHAPVYRLHDNDPCIEVRRLVGFPYYPVHKSPEEVAFTELDYLLGIFHRLDILSVQSFHDMLFFSSICFLNHRNFTIQGKCNLFPCPFTGILLYLFPLC